ncbi:deoxyribonuclease/rho motif-related TRAM [Halorubrum aidingense JCM 13560]|uniref:Deoxyribonuclease/rho motif-related TRAM n=1 Tax=Halorubrum aidingense JCM 13560 TaxID=1230454 RepID=M0PHA9_9EURY|nr:TRAM domain-containing protein [Halorubrum aidingense]EMA68155.1 deoxyribonuclease/rho motif-related TRAM [Halorubrum aidingense JCM 13560]
MVEITDSLACLFTGEIEERDGDHVVTIPASELEHGTVAPNDTYRVALIHRDDGTDRDAAPTDAAPDATAGNGAQPAAAVADQSSSGPDPVGPPVSEGDVRDVTIETLGDKGDGIAKIERGYVVIVPDSRPGDEPTVEITSVRENVSFANVIDE